MKRLLTFLLGALLATPASIAQITIANHSVTPFSCSPARVLDITVVNSSPETISTLIKATLTSTTNQGVFIARSTTIELKPGLSRLSSSAITEEIIVADNVLGQYCSGTSKLLEGSYQLCFEIEAVGFELPLETCFPLIASSSTFLHLVSPSDKSTINTQNPLLNWVHSGTIPVTDPRESFELVLVEKPFDQSAVQALAENSPLLFIPKLQSHVTMYPINVDKLEFGKEYAWQVIHKYDGYFVQSTECWTFQLDDWEDPRDVKYVDVSASKGSDVVQVFQSFFFRFDEPYQSKELVIEVYDQQLNRIEPQPDNDQADADQIKQYGFNGYRLNLSDYNLKPGNYKLLIRDAKGKQYSVKIHYNR